MAAAHGEESIRGVKGEKKKSRFSLMEELPRERVRMLGKFGQLTSVI
jgi:hypothetical protein